MKRMILLAGTMVLLAMPASLCAADVAGKWIAEAPAGPQGNVEITLTFEVDGEKVTGTLDNPSVGPAEIKEGKIEGDKISFHVVREFGGNQMKVMWKGTVAGDEIKFQRTVDMSGFGGGQGGGQGGGGFGGGQGGGAPKASPDIIAKRVK